MDDEMGDVPQVEASSGAMAVRKDGVNLRAGLTGMIG
jgi:hypothetical protein